jgi:hypothetical protein
MLILQAITFLLYVLLIFDTTISQPCLYQVYFQRIMSRILPFAVDRGL